MNDTAGATRRKLTLTGRASPRQPRQIEAEAHANASSPETTHRPLAAPPADPIETLLAPVRASLDLCDEGSASLEAFTRMLMSGSRRPGRA